MGRPKTVVTEEQREMVKSLAAVGVKQDDIGRIMKIRSAKTLRKNFRMELDFGIAEANSAVARTLYKMAVSGRCAAASMFWLKCQARWSERAGQGFELPDTRPANIVEEDNG